MVAFQPSVAVRPNPPPLSVLVRVMVSRITCNSCNLNDLKYILHIPRHSHHFESLCLLVVASWLVAKLAFSRVQPTALATQALKDIPLAPLIFTSLALPLLESPTFSIIIQLIYFDQKGVSVEKYFSQWLISNTFALEATRNSN